MLMQDYTREQNELRSRLPEMETRLQKLRDTSSNITRFMENARKYTKIPELTSEIVHTFIQRVEMGERLEKYSRTAPQEIRIYYRDVGLIDRLSEGLLGKRLPANRKNTRWHNRKRAAVPQNDRVLFLSSFLFLFVFICNALYNQYHVILYI